MKTTKRILTAIVILIIAACSSSKKSITSPASASRTLVTSPTPLIVVKPATGFHVPGNEELIAIQAKYKDVTLDKLKEGHAIYTQSACINCHGAVNIYTHNEIEWKDIIDDMAQRSNITDAQKDAVYKYVLAIKATQPK